LAARGAGKIKVTREGKSRDENQGKQSAHFAILQFRPEIGKGF
jgi:hypothetical protein